MMLNPELSLSLPLAKTFNNEESMCQQILILPLTNHRAFCCRRESIVPQPGLRDQDLVHEAQKRGDLG